MTTATPRSQCNAGKAPSTALLHRHQDTGAIHALSTKDHATVYIVKNAPDGSWSCSCPAGTNGRACYHVTAAQQRFAGFFARPCAVIVPSTDPELPDPAAPAVRCDFCAQSFRACEAEWQDGAPICPACVDESRDEAERQFWAAVPDRRACGCLPYGEACERCAPVDAA